MGSHRTYNGVSIPEFMYGTAWKKEETTRLVKLAVTSGFTAIDTANQIIHYDEARVGDALLDLSRQGIERESLFLQTKFTSAGGQDHRTPYDASADITTQVGQSFRSSLRHLRTPITWIRMSCTAPTCGWDWGRRTGKSGRPSKKSTSRAGLE